jgi:hypothetical protein
VGVTPSHLLSVEKIQCLKSAGLQSVQGSITNPRLVNPAQRKDWATIFVANIWLARNKKAFDNVLIPAATMETNYWDTISLWTNRCRNKAKRKAISDWATEGRPRIQGPAD